MKATTILFFILVNFTLTGCANLGTKPWQRAVLAKPEMALNADAMDQFLDSHIYFSKEATSGGKGSAAGGCGCN